MWHVWGIGEVYTGLWRGNLRERNNTEDSDVDGRIILTLRLLMSYIYIWSTYS